MGLGLLLVALCLLGSKLLRGAHDQSSAARAVNTPPGAESSPPSKSDRRAGPKLALLERLFKSGQLTRTPDGGLDIRDAALQDLLHILADQAGIHYLHNEQLDGESYRVSGYLSGAGNPREQIEELAFVYDVTCIITDEAFYPIEPGGKLPYPDVQWTFHPRHLKITNIDQVRALIEPMLSETGSLDLDPATGTLTVSDCYHEVARVEALLLHIDRPKPRVTMDVQVVSVSSSESLDWTSSFQGSESPEELAEAVNTVLGFDPDHELAGLDEGGPQQHHFQPSQVDGVLRTLQSRGQLERIAGQTLTTEDNELVSSQFRLRNSPGSEGRIAVTPTLLPDGTVRMKIRSHSPTTDPDPDTLEAGTVARVPDGQSLVIGGALTQNTDDSNLVMIITPTALPPEVDDTSSEPRQSTLPNPLLALLNR